jgi:hypothetical protein
MITKSDTAHRLLDRITRITADTCALPLTSASYKL